MIGLTQLGEALPGLCNIQFARGIFITSKDLVVVDTLWNAVPETRG